MFAINGTLMFWGRSSLHLTYGPQWISAHCVFLFFIFWGERGTNSMRNRILMQRERLAYFISARCYKEMKTRATCKNMNWLEHSFQHISQKGEGGIFRRGAKSSIYDMLISYSQGVISVSILSYPSDYFQEYVSFTDLIVSAVYTHSIFI